MAKVVKVKYGKKVKTYEEQVEGRILQLKAVGAYKTLTEAELRSVAEQGIRVMNFVKDLEIDRMFEDPKEKAESVVLAEKYFNDYTFEYISDKNTLKQLIFLEILNKRLQVGLNEFYKDSQAVPAQMMEALHKNLIQIIELKKILGLTKSDKEATQSDGMAALDLLKKKFKMWRQQNNGSRSLICPHCSKMVMLKIKTGAWEAQKHPYFQDRFLANPELFRLLRLKKITKKEVATILQTSTDYIDWILKKLNPNSVKDIQTDEARGTSQEKEGKE